MFNLFKKKITSYEFCAGMYSVGMNNLDRNFILNIAQAFEESFHNRPDGQGIMEFLSLQGIEKDHILSLLMRINCYQMMLLCESVELQPYIQLMRRQLSLENPKYASDAEEFFLQWKYDRTVSFDINNILGEQVDTKNILYLSLKDAFIKHHMEIKSELFDLWSSADKYNLFINYATVFHKTINDKNTALKNNKIGS